jgi:cyclopropane fatty-acyl-phospholipid synthase-like methyltransferase
MSRPETLTEAGAVETPAAERRAVADYYDRTQILYSALWSRRSLHYGFWEPGTRTRAEAIRNLDRLVARELALASGGRVLDAGCGIGGTGRFLCAELGAQVVGISLSPVQLRRARQAAGRCGCAVPPAFVRADYMRTGFADASFDGVVAIESACYAARKEDFIREAYRLLAPGGRLVVADGFLIRPPRVWERRDYARLLDGFVLPNLASSREFVTAMHRVGFRSVRCIDKRREIMPTARNIEWRSRIGMTLAALPCRAGLFPAVWMRHAWAGVVQRRLFEQGVITYCIVVGTKRGPASGPATQPSARVARR